MLLPPQTQIHKVHINTCLASSQITSHSIACVTRTHTYSPTPTKRVQSCTTLAAHRAPPTLRLLYFPTEPCSSGSSTDTCELQLMWLPQWKRFPVLGLRFICMSACVRKSVRCTCTIAKFRFVRIQTCTEKGHCSICAVKGDGK